MIKSVLKSELGVGQEQTPCSNYIRHRIEKNFRNKWRICEQNGEIVRNIICQYTPEAQKYIGHFIIIEEGLTVDILKVWTWRSKKLVWTYKLKASSKMLMQNLMWFYVSVTSIPVRTWSLIYHAERMKG